MIAYYRDSVTNQSWELLQELQRKFRFVLIGGWAVWLYTRQLKSKDIDIVIELPELNKLQQTFTIEKNDRLRKYEIRQGEVEVDVYLPFFSSPGVPAEQILRDVNMIEGFPVPSLELLLVLKSVAWASRRASAKGRKDMMDIISLMETHEPVTGKVHALFSDNALQSTQKEVQEEFKTITSLPELNLNTHQVARAKKKWMRVFAPRNV